MGYASALIRVAGIDALEREVFGPVLHVATYRAEDLDEVLEAVNASGYGLTLGVQTWINARVQQVVSKARVGNIYVNRNQVGAVVGSQPFGGENLSGTGPKAGGPEYRRGFSRCRRTRNRSSGGPTGRPYAERPGSVRCAGGSRLAGNTCSSARDDAGTDR